MQQNRIQNTISIYISLNLCFEFSSITDMYQFHPSESQIKFTKYTFDSHTRKHKSCESCPKIRNEKQHI
ncbi:hypothetical protein D3Z50_22780 [Clostridiaceae bacterium]|nr:hypothetical protein [Clostridiaceae bacterium]